MIVGVGTDLVEIARIEKACARESFLMRIFTEEERRQAAGRMARFAGDFAVKEAVAKALGTGFRSFLPCEIEVLRDALGKPYVHLSGGASDAAAALGVRQIQVSISDTKTLAMAFAVAEGAERKDEG